jgi:hypothetical protein
MLQKQINLIDRDEVARMIEEHPLLQRLQKDVLHDIIYSRPVVAVVKTRLEVELMMGD